MQSLTEIVGQQAKAMSMAELSAVLLAIAYLLLAIRQNIWCWVCAIISSAIYVVLFIQARLYMESLLYGYYSSMAVYGWYQWRHGGKQHSELTVTEWPLRLHGAVIAIVIVLSLISGKFLSHFSDAELPYLDSLTTWSAVWATFLVARKVLENWWYWLVIDVASIFIYWSRDLQLTALLFVLYVVLIPIGYLNWRKDLPPSQAVSV